MPCYVLSTMTVHDPATYKHYTDVTPPPHDRTNPKRHGGKFLTARLSAATA